MCLIIFIQSFAHQSPCQHRSLLLLRLGKPDLVHRRPGFLHKFKQVLSEQCHEVLRWWEKPAKFSQLWDQHRAHLSQIDMWHSGTQKQKCQRARGSASEKARNERHLENGHHGETGARVSAVQVLATDHLTNIFGKRPGTVRAGSLWFGRMHVARVSCGPRTKPHSIARLTVGLCPGFVSDSACVSSSLCTARSCSSCARHVV